MSMFALKMLSFMAIRIFYEVELYEVDIFEEDVTFYE